MFAVQTNPSIQFYWTPVNVEMLDENGKKKTFIFKAKFRRLSREELDDLSERLEKSRKAALKKAQAEAEGKELEVDESDTLTDAKVIEETLIGWADVTDENGQKLEFNPDNLALLLNVNPVRPTLAKTFFATTYGAAGKN
ncbi:MAG: hypothetical protein H7Z39_10555 [Burkholderiaceae bacterium]|nr:hypothetical protein [Burkholderiaceae bacterium]